MTMLVTRWRLLRARRGSGAWQDEDGLSLIELMIALMVLSVALLALASVASVSLIQLRNSKSRQEATDAASAVIENLRLQNYAAIAMDATDPVVSTLGACDSLYDEPLVTTSIAGQSVPYEQTFGKNGQITVHTVITWFDERGTQACSDPAHDRLTKRVVATASWEDRGTRSVEQSTLVSEVDRGLPAPEFRLGSPDISLQFTATHRANETEICVGHVLRNLGAQDTYDWEVKRAAGETGSTIKDTPAEFSTANGDWTIRAFFETPAQEPAVSPATYGISANTSVSHPVGLPAGIELMVDADGNGRPEEQEVITTGQQSRIWICYRPDNGATLDTDNKFTVTVHSRFDENRVEVLNHTVRVNKTVEMTLFLFDDDTSDLGADNPRLIPAPGNKMVLPVYTMGDVTTLQPERLGTAVTIPDMDTDLDTRDLPGISLIDRTIDGTTYDASVVKWDEQLTVDRTFDPSATLVLYSAPARAFGDSFTPQNVTLGITVEVLNKQESSVVATLASTSYTYEHTKAKEFEQLTIPLTLSSPSILAQQYLRLQIDCLSASVSACQIAFDHETLAKSYLTLAVLT